MKAVKTMARDTVEQILYLVYILCRNFIEWYYNKLDDVE